ncbi:MAG: helicase-related protein [Aggregatilineales bacterium]
MLSQQAERLLLLTATPHSGDPEQFAYFLRLLDSDQFVGPDRVENFAQLNQDALIPHGGDFPSPWFLRRMKEELRDFDGQKLFTQRHPITVPFTLSADEKTLYDLVTEYINQYLPRQTGRKKAPVALARTVLQRRLASSVRAIRRSLERRYERFNNVLREVNALPPAKQEQYLRTQNLLEAYDDEQDTDDADELLNDLAATDVTAAERITDLRAEVAALGNLVSRARRVEEHGDEHKLQALLKCLERAEFAELKDGRGKLLIFTEHRDTLDYLHERLSDKFSLTEIHGGMTAQARKAAQDAFHGKTQICLATEAAGEGINLQFCHLMINYDMPWNPVRLEQRMGRIHRIGQKLDVYIFNFVTSDTIEGRILTRLLEKLDAMRVALGDRVFDVIGIMLSINDVDLEGILRGAAYNPRTINDNYYLQQIEKIRPERLRDLELATGVAMATSHVDLSRIQAQDFRSEEQRLMPEYVQKYFLSAAKTIGMRIEQRADELYRIEHVPLKLRATTLRSAKRFGSPDNAYRKLTFNKRDILDNPQHADAELLSPGHPLFAAVSELVETQLSAVRGGIGIYYDAKAQEDYRLHFFVVELTGEEPTAGGYRSMAQFAGMSVVLETMDGQYDSASPDILHNFEQAEATTDVQPLDPEVRQKIERYVRGRTQRALLEEQRQQREHEIAIREDYLNRTFEALIQATQRKYLELADRVESGQTSYRIARDEAGRRVEELEARQKQKLGELKHLRVLRPGVVRYLGSAQVYPAANPVQAEGAFDAMHADPEVERRAMALAMQLERDNGWTPTDISQRHDGSGFDIRSIGPADLDGRRSVKRIEVKGRSGYNMPVALSTNEWIQAGRHRESYWLYVVWGAGAGQSPQLLVIQNPATKLANRSQPIIKHYLLPADALLSAASE